MYCTKGTDGSTHRCDNLDDTDPISLDRIRDLKHPFYMTKTVPGRVEAYDSVHWVAYMAHGLPKRPVHPCTRKRIHPIDVVACFERAARKLGATHKDVLALQSTKVNVTVKGDRVVFQPVSPIFLLSILQMSERARNTTTKEVRFRYKLVRADDLKNPWLTNSVVVEIPLRCKICIV